MTDGIVSPLRAFWAFARVLPRRLFLLEYWNIGIVNASLGQIVSSGQVGGASWLPEAGPLAYRADPFAVLQETGTILFEDFSYRLGKGAISCASIAEGGWSDARQVFADFHHFSYPFLFVDEGAIYCIPETGEARRVDLYRAAHFPSRWVYEATLLEDFPALDSTVIKWGGRWWLFCAAGDPGREYDLHIWHAPAVRGPWVGHAANPVKSDVSSSRPAGCLFELEGALYRPAQDCSSTYGGAVIVNRVTRLTPTEFEEIRVARIAPDKNSPYPHGIHTICGIGDKTIIDGKRFAFDIRALYYKAKLRRASLRRSRALRDRRHSRGCLTGFSGRRSDLG